MSEQEYETINVDTGSAPTQDQKNWAMYCHLAGFLVFLPILTPITQIVGPLVLWLLKRESSSFIDEQGKEALNFQISMTICLLVSIMLMFIFIGIPIFLALLIYDIIMIIQAAQCASQGKHYRYPYILRLIK
jgi:uncharacterized protein